MNNISLEDPKIAEMCGILLGDGSIGKYQLSSDSRSMEQKVVKFTLSSEEEQYANYIESLFLEITGYKLNKYKRNNEKTQELRIFREDVFEFFTKEIGMVLAPKWDRAKIPEIYMKKELENFVLRGYFDTDGSIVLTDNNGTLYPRIEMKICPSPMQEQFKQILENVGFNFGWYEIGKGKIRAQLNGKEQLKLWLEDVGMSNKKHWRKVEKLAGRGFEPRTSGCLRRIQEFPMSRSQ